MTNDLDKQIEFNPVKTEHAKQIAGLHISGISTGFISSLGIDFVTALCEAIAKSKCGFGFVAQEQDEVIGEQG